MNVFELSVRFFLQFIVLNVGLERGLITPTLFSVGVFMAIVTTLMATPMFDRFDRKPDAAPLEVPA